MRAYLMMAVLAGSLAGLAQAGEPAEGILVSPAWLAGRLGDPSLVVLQVANLRDDYARAHIPGARFLWPSWLVESTPERSAELPPVKLLRRRLEDLGVTDHSRIVLCHMQGDVTTAARMYVTLDYLGLGERTSILDGGLEAWKAEGRPLTSDVPKIEHGKLSPRIHPAVVVDLAYVQARYRGPDVHVVDARSPQTFGGAPVGGMPRTGHIPGAVNVPYSTLTDSTDRYLPPDSLRARFARAGVTPGRPVIAYCNVGRSASAVYVAAKLLGYDVHLYDGSFEEWSRHPEPPVEGKTTN